MRDIAAQLLADSNVKVIQGKSDILRIVFRIEMYSNKSRAYFELIIIFAFRLIKGIVLPDGRFERCNKRMDAMIFVEPSLNSLAQKWTFKIGVEVKANIKDLLDDNKMPSYLGWSDFFLIAVPDGLIKAALRKAAADSRIGVVSLTSGKIHKIPAWQDVSLGRKYEVMEQAFYRYTNKGGMIRTFKMTN